jgi:flagellar M-ring protein FliF
VINDRLAQPATKGKAAVWQPRSADEIRNLTALAQASVGFDSARGDMLTVEDLAFDGNRAEEPVPIAEKVLNTAENSPLLVKYLALLIGLMVVVAFGIRPALRHVATAQLGSGAARAGKRELGAGAAVAAAPALKPPEAIEVDPERQRNQEIFEQVTSHLKREPTQSSRLLQSWIHSD